MQETLERRVRERTAELEARSRQFEANNRLLESLMQAALRHAEEQKYLADLMRELECQDDPRVLMERVGERLQVRVGAVAIVTAIGTLEDGLEVWTVCGEVPEVMRPHCYKRLRRRGREELWQALESNTPLYIDDTTRSPYAERRNPAMAEAKLAGAAYVPFVVGAGRIGAIGAMRFGEPTPWTLEQRQLLEATAQTLNLAFQRATRIRELDDARRYAEAMVAISKLTDQDQSIEACVRALGEIFSTAADVECVLLIAVAADCAVGKVTSCTPRIEAPMISALQESRARGQGVLWGMLERGGPLYVDDYAGMPQAIPALVKGGLRSAALIPLEDFRGAQHTVLAALRVGRARPWSDRDRSLFEAAARGIRLSHARRRSVQELRAAALTDPLTGLGNRRAFLSDLQSALEEADRKGEPVTLLTLDVDGLKEVNDRDGHERGDELLRQFAQLLPFRLRSQDRLYRIGGDEFVALLERTGLQHSEGIQQRIIEALHDVQRAGFEQAGVSAGFAVYPLEARSAEHLMALSDERMYREKHHHHQFRHSAQPYPSRQSPTLQESAIVNDVVLGQGALQPSHRTSGASQSNSP